ncbi:MAG: glycosyltransferase [Anaerolineae bacterium]|nr:glycosyltransferase [Anaerolineae bacterium]
MPRVSVVVPCYNEERTIAHLLTALCEQTYPRGEVEVVIADGLSTDRTREVIAAFASQHPDMQIHVVDNPARNIPTALNIAIANATGSIILRLDAHAIPAGDYIEQCVGALDAGLGENVGGVWRIHPYSDSLIARSIALAAAHPFGVGDARYRYSSKAGLVDTVPFGCFLRETVEAIGGYDESLLTNEDYELNARIRLNGGRIYFTPHISAIYFSRATLPELARQYWRYGYWKFRMLKRYPRTLRARQALPPVFVGGMISLLLLGLFWRPAALVFLSLFAVYFLTLLAVSIVPAARAGNIMMAFGIPLAMMTMHFCWGAGFLYSALTNIFRDR